MTRITLRGTGSLVIAAVFSVTANAQQPTLGERAPVPRQVLVARTALVGNGGSETYGGESYFDLTQYDGGPNRAYDSFYKAMKEWGHFDLVGSTDEADVLLVIRFTNPVVARDNAGLTGDLPHDWIYDPQLELSINDPKTGLPLWSLTEHIEPASSRAAANRHFDEAMDRLVDDLQRLILHPEESVARHSIALPPGAIAAAQRKQRELHAGIGMLLGGAAVGVIAARTDQSSCPSLQFDQCFSRAQSHALAAFAGGIAGALVGAFIGWKWPVN